MTHPLEVIRGHYPGGKLLKSPSGQSGVLRRKVWQHIRSERRQNKSLQQHFLISTTQITGPISDAYGVVCNENLTRRAS